MDSDLYNMGKAAILQGIDWENDTIKIALLSSSYTPDIDADEYWDDISADEVSGDGYTAGGKAITGTVTVNDTDDNAKADATDLTWVNVTVTFQTAVIYKDTGTDSTSPLIGYWNNEAEVEATAQNLTLQFNASGILQGNAAGFGF